jgi:DNA-binding CsgD family transcriptional regulator
MTLTQKGLKLMHAQPDNSASMEDLVRRLVHKAQESNPTANPDPSSPILVVDVDGFHYTLLRSPCTETCHLSPREKEIVRLVAEGLPNKCIGAVLEISCWTVATHVQRIFSKLGVTSRAAMVARFIDPAAGHPSARSPSRKMPVNQPGFDADSGGGPKVESEARGLAKRPNARDLRPDNKIAIFRS